MRDCVMGLAPSQHAGSTEWRMESQKQLGRRRSVCAAVEVEHDECMKLGRCIVVLLSPCDDSGPQIMRAGGHTQLGHLPLRPGHQQIYGIKRYQLA